jgi:hypothetical protein
MVANAGGIAPGHTEYVPGDVFRGRTSPSVGDGQRKGSKRELFIALAHRNTVLEEEIGTVHEPAFQHYREVGKH